MASSLADTSTYNPNIVGSVALLTTPEHLNYMTPVEKENVPLHFLYLPTQATSKIRTMCFPVCGIILPLNVNQRLT